MLTEQEEKDLKAAVAAIPNLTQKIAALEPLAAKVPELENTIKAKDTVIAELQNGQKNLSQQSEKLGLKTAYPDVPEPLLDHALALPADKREALLKPVQEGLKLKAGPKPASTTTNPMDLWKDAGGIGPTDEAEKAAQKAEAEKKYAEAHKQGSVFGMLEVRGAELAAHVRAALTGKK